MITLEHFVSSLSPSDAPLLDAVRNYIEWQVNQHAADFNPSDDDDVDLRTYLLYLRAKGADNTALARQVDALRRFYQWARAKGLITHNPLEEYDFNGSLLSGGQSRQDTLTGTPQIGDVERLRALNQIMETLNSSVDIQSALDGTLRTILEVMDLETAWVSMRTDSHIKFFSTGNPPPHGFTLAAARNLPPGLEHDDRRFLRQPPACHCQRLLMMGRLTHADNIVECTRLRDAARAAGDNRGLRFHASVPLISQGRPLGVINVASHEWHSLLPADLQFLSVVGKQVIIALERAHLYEMVEAERIRFEHELQVARQVQTALLPREMPKIPGYHLASAWRPAREMSGDFYDISPLDGGCWAIFIGDVCDKGVAAALYMAMARSLIRSGVALDPNPGRVLADVNQTIIAQCSSDFFVTVFLAILDPGKQTLTYANAGHNPPIMRRASGTIELLKRTSLAIGLFDELQVREETIEIGHGDALLMYTDGVTEAFNPHLKEYSMDRLVSVTATAPRKADELLAYIEEDLGTFTEGAPQSDDVTFFVLTGD
jgi:serine phosphatase RsbU (regulator of sigma subunit)